MRRTISLVLFVFGMPATAFGQATPSDSQTLQALLSEVRELRQELRSSLARMQSGQILLSRLQTQQQVVTRASERLDVARSNLACAQDRQKRVAMDIKRLEDTLSGEENVSQQKTYQDEISRLKPELERSTDMAQQSQTTVFDCEQQLRNEQDKLSTLDNQLDELVKSLRSPSKQ